MSKHIFINRIKMPNIINNFERYLEILTPEEQLHEIYCMIKTINKSYSPCVNVNKKFSMINQLNILKKELLTRYKFHY